MLFGLLLLGLTVLGGAFAAAKSVQLFIDVTSTPSKPPPPEDDPDDALPITGRDVHDATKIKLPSRHRVLGLRSGASLKVWANGTLTQTTFDVTTRADAARILLNNATGVSVRLFDAAIRGRLVYEVPGYIHDELQDFDDQRRNGLKPFQLGNDYMVTADQINELADYWWKYHKDKKHIWTVALPGNYLHLEPGEWYTLQVGGSGLAENINATVELLSLQVAMTPTGLGVTQLQVREVEANWAATSNALVRFLAGGRRQLAVYQQEYVVASSDYIGPADAYCDGTADDVQIQAAIDFVADRGIGGVVRLTRGTFTLTAALQPKAAVTLRGEGIEATIVDKNGAFDSIAAAGSAGSEIVGIEIADLQLTRQDTNAAVDGISLSFCDNLLIRNVKVAGWGTYGIHLADCDVIAVEGCEVTGSPSATTVDGMRIDTCSGHISECIVHDITYAVNLGTTFRGIAVLDSPEFLISSCLIHSFDVVGAGTQADVWGILATEGSERTVILNCVVANLVSHSEGGGGLQGIVVADDCEVIGCSVSGLRNWARLAISTHLARGIAILGADSACAGCSVRDSELGVFVQFSANRSNISGLTAVNCGQLIDRPGCERTTGPAVVGEVTNHTVNATFARDATQAFEGSNSYKHNVTAGGSLSEAHLTDGVGTTDMHGMFAGVEYTVVLQLFIPSGGLANTEIELILRDYDGSWQETAVNPANTTDAWQEVTVTRSLRASAAAFGLLTRIAATASTNEHIFVDNIRFYPTDSQNEHDNCVSDAGTDTRVA